VYGRNTVRIKCFSVYKSMLCNQMVYSSQGVSKVDDWRFDDWTWRVDEDLNEGNSLPRKENNGGHVYFMWELLYPCGGGR